MFTSCPWRGYPRKGCLYVYLLSLASQMTSKERKSLCLPSVLGKGCQRKRRPYVNLLSLARIFMEKTSLCLPPVLGKANDVKGKEVFMFYSCKGRTTLYVYLLSNEKCLCVYLLSLASTSKAIMKFLSCIKSRDFCRGS